MVYSWENRTSVDNMTLFMKIFQTHQKLLGNASDGARIYAVILSQFTNVIEPKPKSFGHNTFMFAVRTCKIECIVI